MQRKTINLRDDEARRLAAYLTPGSPEQEALGSMLGEEAPPYSESAVLKQLVLAGLRQVEEKMLVRGYEALARARSADDERYELGALEMYAETLDDE